MKYAFVCTNLADMRSRPDHRSERVNQALFGEVLKVMSTESGFCKVCQIDRYKGWISESYLGPAEKKDFDNFVRNADLFIVSDDARLTDRDGKATPPFFVYYGTRLSGKRTRDGHLVITLPNNEVVQLRAGNAVTLKPPPKKGTPDLARKIITEARRFLGVPYLWGGITPAGIDCSGFARAVYRRFGVELERDTKDQVKQGRKVDRQSIKSGDLIFSPGHVGIAIGRNRIIHATRSGGGVRINSIEPGGPDYRADIDKKFTEARRLLPCT